MAERALIKLENVWKVYQFGKIELAVLKDVSLEVAPGAFVVILGPSGSGKSTMLHMVGCLDLPTRGKIFLDNRDISQMSEDELAKNRGQKIGFIFQQFNLLPNLSALENVMMPMLVAGEAVPVASERAMVLLDAVGLGHRVAHKPGELSGGERQRAAVARALVNRPACVLGDEPTGNLDEKTAATVFELMLELNRSQGTSLVVVTHDLRLARRFDRVLELRAGRLHALSG